MIARIASWPFWFKLTIGIGIIAVTLLLGTLITRNSNIMTIQFEFAQIYLKETGSHQARTINDNLQHAAEGLEEFLTSPVYRPTITSSLQQERMEFATSTSFSAFQKISTVIKDGLLTPRSDVYNAAWLLSRDGEVLGSSTLENRPPPYLFVTQRDQSNSDEFITGRMLNPTLYEQSLIIKETNSTTDLLLVHPVFTDAGARIGYLVTSLNLNQILGRTLIFNDNTLRAYSFIAIAEHNRTLAVNRFAIEKGQEFISEYSDTRAIPAELEVGLENDSDRNVIGYYRTVVLPEVENGRVIVGAEISQSNIDDRIISNLSENSMPLILTTFLMSSIVILTLVRITILPLRRLGDAMRALGRGSYDVSLPAQERTDEVGILTTGFVNLRHQLRNFTDDMSRRIDLSVRDMEATQEISRVAATQRDLDTLMQSVVELVIERFPSIYHAQIFLMDDRNEYALLRASTGEVGRQLLARGHRLAVGSVSVIGQVTEHGQTIIERDIMASNVHRQNEFLRETRAELAIPLRLSDRIIGALDVQSKQSESFDDALVRVLQTMADQISIAIENARLYGEARRRLQEIADTHRAASGRAWLDFMNTQRTSTLQSAHGYATQFDFSALRKQAIHTGEVTIGDVTDRNTIPIVVPITARNQVIGTVNFEVREQDFDENRVQLAEELVNRLGISLDNARLFQQTQRAIERERVVNAISTQLSRQPDIDSILQTAVREVGKALRAPLVNIQFNQHQLQEEQETSTDGSANGDYS